VRVSWIPLATSSTENITAVRRREPRPDDVCILLNSPVLEGLEVLRKKFIVIIEERDPLCRHTA
jgi:hypothetical protein